VFFRQYELACLSLFSYLIGDTTTGRAVVVDPQRDVSAYLADAAAAGLHIERVIETHVHADFLSGHLELAAATGAVVSYGDRASVAFAIEPLADGQVLSLGDVSLEIRHTPGHTPEGLSIVVRDRPGAEPVSVLSGDTLFIGDVGRPDLLASAGHTATDMAHDLHRSLHQRLLTLPDATAVYPAHGAGSACGKHMSAATTSTIGEQRATNYALQPMTAAEFVAVVTAGQPAAPPYFAHAAATNAAVHALLDEHAPTPLIGVDEAMAAAAAGAVLLDTRTAERFATAHARGSINVGIDGRFAEYAGDVITHGRPIVLIAEPGRADEARVRLARIGYDDVVGAVTDLERGLLDHPEHAAFAHRVSAAEVASWRIGDDDVEALQVVDVRGPSETAIGGTVPGAHTVPLPQLTARLAELDAKAPTIVYCAGGYRSSIAASVLRAAGFTTVADIIGGYGAWLAATAPTA
jgi:hydroxyacylglutathione hydrolase